MDEKNVKILEYLEKDGRMSFAEIGKKLDISRVAVKKRVMKMEAAGILCGYKPIIHREGYTLMYMYILTVEEPPEELLNYLNRCGYVTQIFRMAGTNRLQATATAPDISELKYLSKMLQKTFKGTIKKLECHVVKDVIRDDFGGVAYDPLKFARSTKSNKGDEHIS